MRLPYIENNGAKDIRSTPPNLSLVSKVGRVLIVVGIFVGLFSHSRSDLGAVGALVVALGLGFLFLGRKSEDQPGDRLK